MNDEFWKYILPEDDEIEEELGVLLKEILKAAVIQEQPPTPIVVPTGRKPNPELEAIIARVRASTKK